MASLRAKVKAILNMDTLDKQIREVRDLLQRPDLMKNPIALVYNLAGDLFVENSLRLKEPESEKSIRIGLGFYEKAAQLAPHCVETAAAHGGALIAVKLFNTAEVVLKRGISISDHDAPHPMLNHIAITSGTQEELLERARHRMRKDLQYISECRLEGSIGRVLKQLTNIRGHYGSILNSAKSAANNHVSIRGRLLYSHAVLALLRSGHLSSDGELSDEKREMVFQSALADGLALAAEFPNSLVIAMHCAKLQVSLGLFDDAQHQYCRALGIQTPDDPRDHAVSLDYTKGVRFQDRVLYARLSILCDLISVLHMIEGCLSEEIKSSVLSVHVHELLHFCKNDEKQSFAVLEIVDNVKANNSWTSWRCWQDSTCFNYTASTTIDFLMHVWFSHAYHDVPLPDALLERLSAVDAPDAGYPGLLDLAQDDDGLDVICVKGLDELLSGAADVLTQSLKETTHLNTKLRSFVQGLPEEVKGIDIREKLNRAVGLQSRKQMDTAAQDLALSEFFNCLSTLDLKKESPEAFDVLEEPWLKLLKSSAVDNSEALMPFIAIMKLNEINDWIEDQLDQTKEKLQVPVVAMTPEHEALVQIPETKGVGNRVSAAQPKHYAYMYGRRMKALSTLAAKKKIAQEAHCDPYKDKVRHEQFTSPAPSKMAHLSLCSFCFFERATSRRFSQLLYHFAYLHGVAGVKCTECGVRFATASALEYHMEYIHRLATVPD